jgi:hypothetical protein
VERGLSFILLAINLTPDRREVSPNVVRNLLLLEQAVTIER